uniref:Uncharacterized protein n=1 Tax=Romanomermis culicivorax TaxID=13658 RepID=A0A915J1S6_ROMCU
MSQKLINNDNDQTVSVKIKDFRTVTKCEYCKNVNAANLSKQMADMWVKVTDHAVQSMKLKNFIVKLASPTMVSVSKFFGHRMGG